VGERGERERGTHLGGEFLAVHDALAFLEGNRLGELHVAHLNQTTAHHTEKGKKSTAQGVSETMQNSANAWVRLLSRTYRGDVSLHQPPQQHVLAEVADLPPAPFHAYPSLPHVGHVAFGRVQLVAVQALRPLHAQYVRVVQLDVGFFQFQMERHQFLASLHGVVAQEPDLLPHLHVPN